MVMPLVPQPGHMFGTTVNRQNSTLPEVHEAGHRGLAGGQRVSLDLHQRRAACDLVFEPLTTVKVTLDGYCFEWCTLLRATTPFASS